VTTDCSLPLVTALCPTYGRFQRLREALACFLAQDYPNKQLIILNDAPVHLEAPEASGVHVLNLPPFPNLGAKRQALLAEAIPFCNQGVIHRGWETDVGFADEWEEAEMPRFCAHWDDDDLYLPWHLSICVEALMSWGAAFDNESGETPDLPNTHRVGAASPPRLSPARISCVKPHGAWYWPSVAPGLRSPGEGGAAKEGRPDGQVHGIHHNVFEGQMVFDRQRALDLGGYSQKHSGQAADLMVRFVKAGEFRKFEPKPGPSYVYRWDRRIGHISALASSRKGMEEGRNVTALKEFQRRNTDFGDGQPLTPAELTPYWHAVLESARKVLSKDGYAAFGQRLNATEPQSTQRKEKTRVEDEKEKEDAFLLSLCQFAPFSVLSVPRWLT